MEKIEKFLQTKYYQIAIVVLTFFFWAVDLNRISGFDILEIIGISLFVVIISLILIFYSDTRYIIPLLVSMLFMFSTPQKDLNVGTLDNLVFIYILIPILVGALIYHIVKFKVKITYKALLPGLLLVAIGFILPFTINDYTQKYILSYIIISLLGVIYLVLYIFFVNTTKGDFFDYILFFLFLISLLIAFQVLTGYIRYINSKDHSISIFKRISMGISDKWDLLPLGWGIHNDAAIYLVLLLPISMYYLLTKKMKYIYGITFLFVLVICLLTMSRGAFIGLFVEFILLIPILIKYSDIKSKITILVLTAVLLTFSIAAFPLIKAMIEKLFSYGLNWNGVLNGRQELYEMAWKQFILHPIVGGGWFADHYITQARMVVYHSTFFQSIGTMGLFGLGSLIFHLIQVVKLIRKKFNLPLMVISTGLIASHVHGLIDNTYYMVIYMVVMVVLYAAIEHLPDKVNDNAKLANIDNI